MEFKLVRWDENSYKEFFEQSNDKDLYENMSDTFPKSLIECKEMVKWFSNSEDKKEYVRAIQIDNQIAGCIGAFFDKDIYCKSAELAYWLGTEFCGKGIMTEVIKTFTDDLFVVTDVVRVFARPFKHNYASKRVLEKAGYLHEGTMRKSVYKNGRIFDADLYAIVRH